MPISIVVDGRMYVTSTWSMVYAFEAKTRNAAAPPVESALAAVGGASTNQDGDVTRDGSTNVLDLLYVRDAILLGGLIGVHYSWATDVNDDSHRRTDISDMAAVRFRILNP